MYLPRCSCWGSPKSSCSSHQSKLDLLSHPQLLELPVARQDRPRLASPQVACSNVLQRAPILDYEPWPMGAPALMHLTIAQPATTLCHLAWEQYSSTWESWLQAELGGVGAKTKTGLEWPAIQQHPSKSAPSRVISHFRTYLERGAEGKIGLGSKKVVQKGGGSTQQLPFNAS